MYKFLTDLPRAVVFSLMFWVASIAIPILGSAPGNASLADKLGPVGLVLFYVAQLLTFWVIVLAVIKIIMWLSSPTPQKKSRTKKKKK